MKYLCLVFDEKIRREVTKVGYIPPKSEVVFWKVVTKDGQSYRCAVENGQWLFFVDGFDGVPFDVNSIDHFEEARWPDFNENAVKDYARRFKRVFDRGIIDPNGTGRPYRASSIKL